jgi:hypothetical protein
MNKSPHNVIPAKAGIQKAGITPQLVHWIPAFAGMTRYLFFLQMLKALCVHKV